MKKLFFALLLSLGLTTISYAGPYDDWPDDAICMWLDQKPTHAGYLGEAKKRNLTCEGGKAVTAPTKTTTVKKTTTSVKVKPTPPAFGEMIMASKPLIPL